MSRSSFFEDSAADDALEARSGLFWDSLVSRIDADLAGGAAVRSVLDFGCHRGGLLERLARRWPLDRIIGVEPIGSARARARLRLQSLAADVVMLEPSSWSTLPAASQDLVVSHEVLYLIADLRETLRTVAHVLAPHGSAYVVLGCHTENPLWPAWREELRAQGQSVYDHAPLDVLTAGALAGLATAVRPLREPGWAHLDPTDPGFAYPSVSALLDHQFRHKLLFRFRHL